MPRFGSAKSAQPWRSRGCERRGRDSNPRTSIHPLPVFKTGDLRAEIVIAGLRDRGSGSTNRGRADPAPSSALSSAARWGRTSGSTGRTFGAQRGLLPGERAAPWCAEGRRNINRNWVRFSHGTQPPSADPQSRQPILQLRGLVLVPTVTGWPSCDVVRACDVPQVSARSFARLVEPWMGILPKLRDFTWRHPRIWPAASGSHVQPVGPVGS
jgi:hypothetical protein